MSLVVKPKFSMSKMAQESSVTPSTSTTAAPASGQSTQQANLPPPRREQNHTQTQTQTRTPKMKPSPSPSTSPTPSAATSKDFPDLAPIAPRNPRVLGGGIGIGIAKRGVIPPHAVTPGNTPSSLERLGRKIAAEMGGDIDGQVSGNGGVSPLGQGVIAPSYERRFNAGLRDIDMRLALQETPTAAHAHVTPPASLKTYFGSLTERRDWPMPLGTGSDIVPEQDKEKGR